MNEEKINLINTIFAIFLLTITIAAVWLFPSANGDLFISLAGGKDVLNGNLLKPDTWSFTTHGRLYINQNWGSDVILFAINAVAGEWGLLILKLLLIISGFIFMALIMYKSKIPVYPTAIFYSLGLICFSKFLELRPNLFTITLVPFLMYLLYCSKEKNGFIWLAGLVVIIWSNLHSGFVFGLGMMLLWIIISIINSMLENKKFLLKKNINLITCALITAILTFIINPFGLKGLHAALLMTGSKVWKDIAEWEPVWGKSNYGNITGFLIFICFYVGVIFLKISRVIKNRKSNKNAIIEYLTPLEIFELILSLTAILMALLSRRFIPIAILACLPAFISGAWHLMNKNKILPFILTMILIFLTFNIYRNVYYYYSQKNNLFSYKATIFEKMNGLSSYFPVNLMKFIIDNNIKGNLYCQWNYEGFIRWNYQEVKIFCGGRSQLVYDEKIKIDYDLINEGSNALDLIHQHEIHLIIVPVYEVGFKKLIKKVLFDGHWLAIYADYHDILLVDTDYTGNQDLIDKAINNKLIYYHKPAGELSREVLLLGNYINKNNIDKIKMFSNVLEKYHCPWIYFDLSEILNRDSNNSINVENIFYREMDKIILRINSGPPAGENYYVPFDEMVLSLYNYYKSQGSNDKLIKLKKYIRFANKIGSKY